MKAVILAAGEGVRLRPLTAFRPKHLLPIGDAPLLEHLLRALSKVGVREVLLVTGYRAEKVKEAFKTGSRLGLKITYAQQSELNGTGNALMLARSYVGDQSFLAVYGDIYIAMESLLRIVQAYHSRRAQGLIAVVEAESLHDFGIVKLDDDGRLVDIVEKPVGQIHSNLANAGLYILSPEIFEEIIKLRISPRGEFELTDAVLNLARRSTIYGAKINAAEWLDVGRPWDLLEANERYLKDLNGKVDGQVESGVWVKGSIKVEEGAVVKSGSYLEGPLIIGASSQVGPNCYLRPYTTLGRNVKVGSFCEVKNSIIMDGTRVPHLSYVGDSIIGENCNLGAGTITGNIRLDRRNVKSNIKGLRVDTGRRKLGAILGDNVQIGISVNLMPGVKIGQNSRIGPGVVVYSDCPAGTKVEVKQQLMFEEKQ